MKRTISVGILAVATIIGLPTARADEPAGQADLDKAVQLKATATNLSDLEMAAELCESAILKGLDKEEEVFATQLLTSSLSEYASKLAAAIFDRQPPDPRWKLLRQVALRKLETALQYDTQLISAHSLIARLHALPGGNRRRGLQAANQAVKLAKNDKQQLSRALLLRGNLGEEKKNKLADYNQAVTIDPKNHEARRTRGLLYLVSGDHEKAIADFSQILKEDADNVTLHHALAEAFTNLNKFDEAKQHADKSIELQPKQSLGYSLRAKIHAMKNDAKAALLDLNKAIELEPRDIAAILMRARLHQAEGSLKLARNDVERALINRPGLPQAILLRSMLSAAEGKFDSAISDISGLLQGNPKNVPLRMQKAAYLSLSQRPRAAVKVYSTLLAENPRNLAALRGRADAMLSIGKQAEAIVEFEKILRLDPKNDGALNNLAWVLATSPNDKLRDSKRSIELATLACEVTEHKRPHIISTLAAGYAEAGDFESAIKWSNKAVEMGEGEIKEQLKKELESYQQKKPWRELQEVKERPEPGTRGGAFEL